MVETFKTFRMKYEPFMPKWNKFQYNREKCKECQKADSKTKHYQLKECSKWSKQSYDQSVNHRLIYASYGISALLTSV